MPVKFMATKVLYGHERAQVCRMMLHITRTLRDCYAPALSFAEASDLMLVLCEVFIAHANGRPPGASKLARSLEMPRTTLLRKLGRLTELGLVVRVGRSYCLTEKINPPNLRGLARSHVSQMIAALNSMSKMNDQELTPCAGARHVALTGGRMHEITRNRAHVMKP